MSLAPGRVCLFGEHQDYLGMPVIAAAIPLACRMVFQPRTDGLWRVRTPQLKFEWACHANEAATRHDVSNPRAEDFLKAALHEAMARGWDVSCGGDVLCSVSLPLQAGCSSSTAMVVAWIHGLARVAGVALEPMALAQLAHQAEVTHFGASGGWMDHVASSFGGVVRIHPDWRVERLPPPQEGVWVLADSGEPKDTKGHLDRCKSGRLALLERLGGEWLHPTALPRLGDEDQAMATATWENRALEALAAQQWGDDRAVAHHMTAHHNHLRDGLGLSTPTLERLGRAAMESGGWGWKLVGSGGGGSMVAWVPQAKVEGAHHALRMAGAHGVWTLEPSKGAVCRSWQPPKVPMVALAAGKSSRMKDTATTALTQSDRALIASRSKAMLPVGEDGKPFLAWVLERACREGVDACCLVISSEDALTESLIEPWIPEGLMLDVVRQTIPQGRDKPWGTADAVACALMQHPEWLEGSVAVCNGDNLPPKGAFQVLGDLRHGMLGFARDQLGLPASRVEAFAVARMGAHGEVLDIVEKPSGEEVKDARDSRGDVWVSMNMFRLPGAPLLSACQEVAPHLERGEKELPTAAWLVAQRTETPLQLRPCRGAFVDFTHPGDWQHADLKKFNL